MLFENVSVSLFKPPLENGKPDPASVRSSPDFACYAAPMKPVRSATVDRLIFLSRESLVALGGVHLACHPYLAQTFCHAL
jgi:hypothetical protein